MSASMAQGHVTAEDTVLHVTVCSWPQVLVYMYTKAIKKDPATPGLITVVGMT